jgi:polysaccharide export outer membrane protein
MHVEIAGIFSRRVAVVALAIALLHAGACRQYALYQAADLPSELIAPRVGNLHNIDLSRLTYATGNSELLYPGDVVAVSIATGLEKEDPPEWKLRIGNDGTVNVPLVGQVAIAQLQLTEAEQTIRNESIRRGTFVDPNVTVVLAERKSYRVTVVGAVEKPGTYDLPAADSDVLAALVTAGGLTEESGTVLEVRHPPQPAAPDLLSGMPGGNIQLASYQNGPTLLPPQTLRIDLEQVTQTGSADLRLHDGSTVMVMKRPKRFIHVIGLVKKADQFEIPEDQELRLLDAIALAGGLTLEIADSVHVIRNVQGRPDPVVIAASIREAKQNGSANIRLAAGDVVSVEETPSTFVVGTIRDFVRFGFTSAIPGF